MTSRRQFVHTVAGAAAGLYAFGGLASGQGSAPATRRQVSIGGKRIKVIDVHAHCVIPEVTEVVKGTPFANAAAGGRRQRTSWARHGWRRWTARAWTCRR